MDHKEVAERLRVVRSCGTSWFSRTSGRFVVKQSGELDDDLLTYYYTPSVLDFDILDNTVFVLVSFGDE